MKSFRDQESNWTEMVKACLQRTYLILLRVIKILVLNEIDFKKRLLYLMSPMFIIRMLGGS